MQVQWFRLGGGQKRALCKVRAGKFEEIIISNCNG